MINKNYAKAYTEVLEIIKYFPKSDYDKIPKEKIEFFKQFREARCIRTHIYKDVQFNCDELYPIIGSSIKRVEGNKYGRNNC